MCITFVAGVVDTMFVNGGYNYYSLYDGHSGTIVLAACVPNQVTMGQIKDVAIPYVAENPAQRHRLGVQLIGEALAWGFPCR
jgi:hypothetical protein